MRRQSRPLGPEGWRAAARRLESTDDPKEAAALEVAVEAIHLAYLGAVREAVREEDGDTQAAMRQPDGSS